MIVKNTGSSINLNGVIFSGIFFEGVEAGENITVSDVCYIETDEKAYRLDDTMTTKLNLITVMALETLTTGQKGRFLLTGTVEKSSWAYTAGDGIFVPATKGEPSAEAE